MAMVIFKSRTNKKGIKMIIIEEEAYEDLGDIEIDLSDAVDESLNKIFDDGLPDIDLKPSDTLNELEEMELTFIEC